MNQLLPHELDVRPILAAGGSPLSKILATVDQLQPGQALKLIAPFEPGPLYSLLANRGFTHRVHARADGAFEITFEP